MILTHHYTRITARDENAYIKGGLDGLFELASKIKHSRINEPRPWTQRKIGELKSAVIRIVSHLELHFKLTGAPTFDIHPVINGLESARLLFADMPWREGEPEKWYVWEKDLDQKVDDFIQRIESIKAQL
jgi:hypothetical protein